MSLRYESVLVSLAVGVLAAAPSSAQTRAVSGYGATRPAGAESDQ